jgi:hypothetical protein
MLGIAKAGPLEAGVLATELASDRAVLAVAWAALTSLGSVSGTSPGSQAHAAWLWPRPPKGSPRRLSRTWARSTPLSATHGGPELGHGRQRPGAPADLNWFDDAVEVPRPGTAAARRLANRQRLFRWYVWGSVVLTRCSLSWR